MRAVTSGWGAATPLPTRLVLTRRTLTRLVLVVTAVLAALLLCPQPAAAHAELVSSDPVDGTRLDTGPGRVVLTFTESVELGPGQLRVFAPNGDRVETGRPTHMEGRGTTATTGLRPNLGKGTYTVTWLVVSADSHPIRGAFTFVVGEPSTSVTVPVADRGDRTVGVLLGLARWLSFAGFALLAGTAAFLLVCWPAGARVPAARRLALAGWATLLGGTLAHALLQGPYTAGLSLGHVLDTGLVASTLGTRLGHTLMVRVGVLGVVGALGDWALRRLADSAHETSAHETSAHETSQRQRRSLGAVAAAVAATLAATWSVADHAATGTQVALALPTDVVHMCAMGVWLGGLVVLVAVALPHADPAMLRVALPRFSRLAFGCVAVLVLTGTYQTWRQTGSVGALTGTAYGQLLLVKIGLVVALVCLGAISRQWVRDRWTTGAGTREDAGGLHRSVAAETLVGVLTLAVTALLVNAVPARTAQTRSVAASSPPVVNGAADFRTGPGPAGTGSVTVFLDPGRVGVNILQVSVWDATSARRTVPELRATLRQPRADLGPLPVRLTPTGPGQYVAPSVQIPVPGDWKLSVVVRTSEIDEATVTFPLRIG